MKEKKQSQKRRLRFGAILLPYSTPFDQILRATLHAEDLGFDSVWISDHLQRENVSTLECWSTISALAGLTRTIRIGSLATCNSFRNPSLLARIVATASNISGGRIDIAIGLGYDRIEHLANGFEFPRFIQRVERLSETIQILNLLWSSSRVNFNGKYYKLRGATLDPKPKGRVKLWVAGRSKETMKIAAKHAYGVNILPYSGTGESRKISSFGDLEKIAKELDHLSGRKKHLGKSLYCGDGGLIIGRDEREYAAILRRCSKMEGIEASRYKSMIENLSAVQGTVERCRTSINEIRSLGFEELMIIFPGWKSGDYTNMDLFAENFIRNQAF